MNDFYVYDTENVVKEKNNDPIYQPYQLLEENNPELKKQAKDFDFAEQDAKEIFNRLKATAKLHNAFGLAAPQCGIPYKVFVYGAEGEYNVMFNPEIIGFSDETVIMEEGCLSFPFLILNIVRPKDVTVKFQNENAEQMLLTFSGISSRIIQHEFEHLNGVLFITKAKPLALKNGFKKRDKYIKKFARQIVSKRHYEKS